MAQQGPRHSYPFPLFRGNGTIVAWFPYTIRYVIGGLYPEENPLGLLEAPFVTATLHGPPTRLARSERPGDYVFRRRCRRVVFSRSGRS